MNNLDDLIEQLKENFQTLWARIEESSAYNTLREKYEVLPTQTQKFVVAGGTTLIALIFLSIPLSSLSSSSEYVEEFETKRGLIEELISADQSLKKAPPIPDGWNTSMLESNIQNKIKMFGLIEGQGPELSPIVTSPSGQLIPASVQQAGVRVALYGLNLKQTLDIGSQLEVLHGSVKMLGMDIKASAKFPKYYDVVYRMVSYSIPKFDIPKPEKEDKKKPNRRKRSGK